MRALEKRFDRFEKLPEKFETPAPPIGYEFAGREEALRNKESLKYNLPDGREHWIRPMGAWVSMNHYGPGNLFCVPIKL